MKKIVFFAIFVGVGIFVSGCTNQKTRMPSVAPSDQASVKVGDTSKVGVISQIGEKFYFSENGQVPEEIDSYSIDLSDYLGKTVTITGQYSGDTLFVGSIN